MPKQENTTKQDKVPEGEKQDNTEKKVETPIPVLLTLADVSLSLEGLVKAVDVVKAFDSVISERLGTIGQIMARAKNETLPVMVPDAVKSDVVARLADAATWDDLLKTFDSVKTFVSEKFDEAVVASAGDRQIGHKATVETLRADREKAFVLAQSVWNVCNSFQTPGLDKVVMPPKSGSSDKPSKPGGTGNGGKSDGPAISVYKVKSDGTRYFYTAGSSISLVATRAFDTSVEALRSALSDKGVDPGKPFDDVEITLNDKTVTIGGILNEAANAAKVDETS